MNPPENTTEKISGRPCVYILECSDGTLYTGWTNDITKRVKVHNSGKGAKYTRARRPVTVVWREELEDKGAALRREAAIKRLTHPQKLALFTATPVQEESWEVPV